MAGCDAGTGVQSVEQGVRTSQEAAVAASRVLFLLPSYAKTGIENDVAAGMHPIMDYYALHSRLGAEIYDHAALDNEKSAIIRWAGRRNKSIGLALKGFSARRQYDAIFTNG